MSELTNILLGVLLLTLVWLGALSFIVFKIYTHYNRLTKRVKQGNLIKLLEDVLSREELNQKDIARLEKELGQLTDTVSYHIQKIGLVRFNPFNETGGDHSFSLALLDKHDTGFVITGLHTRDRTRVYTKPVKAGKSKYELSKEESRALKEARKS